jgi:hypothetical protein
VPDLETLNPIDYSNNEPKQDGKASFIFKNNVVEDFKFPTIFIRIKASITLKELDFSDNYFDSIIVSSNNPMLSFESSQNSL